MFAKVCQINAGCKVNRAVGLTFCGLSGPETFVWVRSRKGIGHTEARLARIEKDAHGEGDDRLPCSIKGVSWDDSAVAKTVRWT
jgi:hypothetical protein